jgi:tripartite-type tricarboxylate transporter receptor subunit TctC
MNPRVAIDRRAFAALAASCALAPLVGPARADTWPSRPVRLIVPFAPGGSTDVVARITADRLSAIWGQQLVIENKPGAGTNIGAELVAKAEPDGHTMLMGTTSLTTSRNLYRSLN